MFLLKLRVKSSYLPYLLLKLQSASTFHFKPSFVCRCIAVELQTTVFKDTPVQLLFVFSDHGGYEAPHITEMMIKTDTCSRSQPRKAADLKFPAGEDNSPCSLIENRQGYEIICGPIVLFCLT